MNSLYFRPIALVLGVFLLFSSIAIGFQNPIDQASKARQTELHKQGVIPMGTGIQVPFEEKEEQREKDHQQVTYILSYIAFDFKPVLSESNENYDQYDSSRVITRLGLFLLIRSILI